ncbi:hypothetical protein [Paenibacillus luteus]|nr:hypothetical protein [Paenibacillus luteus]
MSQTSLLCRGVFALTDGFSFVYNYGAKFIYIKVVDDDYKAGGCRLRYER